MPTIDKNDPNSWKPKSKPAFNVPAFNYGECENGCNCQEIAEVKAGGKTPAFRCNKDRKWISVEDINTEEE